MLWLTAVVFSGLRRLASVACLCSLTPKITSVSERFNCNHFISMAARASRDCEGMRSQSFDSPSSPLTTMDDLGMHCDGISPITPRTPFRHHIVATAARPSRRPTVREQIDDRNVGVNSTESSVSDLQRNDFILISPREVESTFIHLMTPPLRQGPVHDSSSFGASPTALNGTSAARGLGVSSVSITSPPETRPTVTMQQSEPAANVSIDYSGSAFVPIQDADDASYESEIESDELPIPNVGYLARRPQGDVFGDDLTW